jgi:hypothetical protein
MKSGLIVSLLFSLFGATLHAQRTCASFEYQQEQFKTNTLQKETLQAIENNLYQRQSGMQEGIIIKIPVVVHVLYHYPSEKISDAIIQSQIDALNKYFRRRNSDTTNTPAYFRSLAADCEIEFHLATSDSRKRSTNGIIKKYTPIAKWTNDDKMKFSSEMGDDAWDTKSYLNIWVCNLDKFAGYASLPGGEAIKDGIVISFKAFGAGNGNASGFDQGKTAVHEAGHWLNLRHIWGDTNCGDDGVDDTPTQASYTPGCPTTTRVTCGNGPHGDMYMNYMDFTNDECINMFSKGQKARMRALFASGGLRSSLLASKGLDKPLFELIPVPEEDPRWLHVQLFPNPASTEVTLDLSYDKRWIGKNIFVMNVNGQTINNVVITSQKQRIDVTKLSPGIYFLAAKKDDGESMKLKFIKL